MLNTIIDKMVEEKIDCKEYKEIAEEIDDEEIKAMLLKISEDEHNHYKMLREWINQMIQKED